MISLVMILGCQQLYVWLLETAMLLLETAMFAVSNIVARKHGWQQQR